MKLLFQSELSPVVKVVRALNFMRPCLLRLILATNKANTIGRFYFCVANKRLPLQHFSFDKVAKNNPRFVVKFTVVPLIPGRMCFISLRFSRGRYTRNVRHPL